MNSIPSTEIRSSRVNLAADRNQLFSRTSEHRSKDPARACEEIGQDSPPLRADLLSVSPVSQKALVASRKNEIQTTRNSNGVLSESTHSSLQLQSNVQAMKMAQTQSLEEGSSHRPLTGTDQTSKQNAESTTSQSISTQSHQALVNLPVNSSASIQTTHQNLTSSETVDARMEEYLALIRELSRNKQSAEETIEKIKSFNSGEHSKNNKTTENILAVT